jgi:glycerol kinase
MLFSTMNYLLALDEGTTSARAVLYDLEGRRLAMESQPVDCRYPQSGWVEQDAQQLIERQFDATQGLLARLGARSSDIVALGITNQRESVVVWDRATGAPLAPAINWQCRRTAEYCDQLSKSPEAATITNKTGLVIDAYFSASKLRWILENVPGVRDKAKNGDALFGTVDSWLIWNLTGGRVHVTDITNASRTMLMSLESGAWDSELLKIFDIPAAMLPKIVPSQGVVGESDPSLFGGSIRIAGIAGDQQAALFGQACFEKGLLKNTYGTGCFALLHTGNETHRSQHRLLTTRAATSDSQQEFALEGSVFVGGAAIQWLRDELGVIGSAAESEDLARAVPNSDGVYCVPAFVGLGAPYWRPGARGIITGLSRGTTRAHLVRATLESIAYQSQDLFEAMVGDSGQPATELRVDGGAAQNDFLMQFQADLIGCPVVRPEDTETTALGAAYLAGLAAGVFKTAGQLKRLWRAERTFEPKMQQSERDRLYAGWQEAVARTS